MSKQFEECSLQEATHIEMSGKVHKFIQSGNLHKENSFAFLEAIHKDLLPKLGIKPLKEIKNIEFLEDQK
jgi:hypothetical protein